MGERTAVRTGSAFRLPKKRKYIRKKQRQYLPLYGHEIEMYTVEQGEKRDKRQ